MGHVWVGWNWDGGRMGPGGRQDQHLAFRLDSNPFPSSPTLRLGTWICASNFNGADPSSSIVVAGSLLKVSKLITLKLFSREYTGYSIGQWSPYSCVF